MNELVRCINEISCKIKNTDKLVWTSDFNFPSDNWAKLVNNNDYLLDLCGCIYNNKLKQIVFKPTRKGNILDLIFTENTITVTEVDYTEPLVDSDHCGIVETDHYACISDMGNASSNA